MDVASLADDVAREAAGLVVGSDVMAVVALVTSAGAWTAAGWLQAKAAAPGATHGSQLGAAPQLIFGSLRTATRLPVIRAAMAPASLVALAVTLSSLLVVPLAIAAAAFLVLSGHVPTGPAALLLGVSLLIASVGAAATISRVRACDGRHDWAVRRGPHIGIAVLGGEALVLGSALLVAAAVTHTENSIVSFVDIACAALVARAVALSRHPPAGAVIADLAFVTLLTATDVSIAASVAVVIVWRASSVLAWALLKVAAARRGARPPLRLDETPTGSAAGEWVHRLAFRALGVLPDRVRDGARQRLFDTLFAISDDPWAYDALPYERRKRSHLMGQLPSNASVVVDVGCADGHVIDAISRERPQSLVIGIDISENAVQAARRRTAAHQNTRVMRGSVAEAAHTIRRTTTRQVDLLILSEVLYYLGTADQVERDLAGLRPLLAAHARVILVHPENDAKGLHLPALEALACEHVTRVRMPDPDRPIVLDIGRPKGTTP